MIDMYFDLKKQSRCSGSTKCENSQCVQDLLYVSY